MKRFVVVCLLVATTLAWSVALSAEEKGKALHLAGEKGTPKYKGKPLTYWIERLQKAQKDDEQHEAALAIMAFGADAAPAVPAIIEMLDDRSLEYRKLAITMIRSLGPIAKDAVPKVVRLLKESKSPRNEPWGVDQELLFALGAIGPEAKEAVPLLKAMLDESETRLAAIWLLYHIGPTAKSALPAIRQALVDELKSPKTKGLANLEANRWMSFLEIGIATLGFFGPDSIPTLKELVENPQLFLEGKTEAVKALAKIGPEAKEAVPLLKKLLKSEQAGLQSNAVIALWRIQKDEEAIRVAKVILKTAVARMDKAPSSSERRPYAIPANPLSASLDNSPEFRDDLALREVVVLIGEMGPSAKDMLPDLKKLLLYQESSVRAAAAEAIQTVNPSEKPVEKEQP